MQIYANKFLEKKYIIGIKPISTDYRVDFTLTYFNTPAVHRLVIASKVTF